MTAGLSAALDRIVAHEATDYGWRGLTASGEVIEVRGRNGDRVEIPDDFRIENTPGVADYLTHYNRGISLFLGNDPMAALTEYDAALGVTSTVRARFNRSLALLAVGRWREGFAAYEARHEFSPATAQMREAASSGITRWRGEDIRGRRLMLVHDAGFGDTIMMLRYVPMLQRMGAEISLVMPPELQRLADQAAPRAVAGEADFYCGMLSLLHLLDQDIETIPSGRYLAVDPALVERWRARIGTSRARRIGIAWSVGRTVAGDYPRACPLAELVRALPIDAELYSVQQHGALGVRSFQFKDFADCAALISLMDRIVTVDTAAVHVAGAIEHPDITVLLGQPASWRWLGNPFYPGIRIAQQAMPGDWAGALAQL